MAIIPILRQIGGSSRWPSTLVFTQVASSTIDDEFVAEVTKHKWTLGSHGYARVKVRGENVLLQHFIWRLAGKPALAKGHTLDHKDVNKLNNTVSNLRSATCSIQIRNRPKLRTAKGVGCSSKFKGVRFNRGGYRKKWRVHYADMAGVVFPALSFVTDSEAALCLNEMWLQQYPVGTVESQWLPNPELAERGSKP